MKLFFSFNEDFREITDLFLSSMKDDFELMPIETQNFRQKWKLGGGPEGAAMKRNTLDFAFENTEKDEVFILSDTDIKFYKPVVETLKEEIKNYEILFQKEHNKMRVNIGFIAMRNNGCVKKFWNDVCEFCLKTNTWDQKITNNYLYDGYKINWSRMSDKFWNWSMGQTGVEYNEDTCLHHANCAMKKDQKINQFLYVENCFKNREKIDYKKDWM